MLKLRSRLILLLLALSTLSLMPLRQASAAGPTFTVTLKSVFLRSGPSFNAPRSYSVFQNQSYAILARTADNAWLQLDFAGGGGHTWVFAAYGTVSGSVDFLPVVAVTDTFIPPPLATPASGGYALPVAGPVRLTITVKSGFARSGPSLSAARVHSVFSGEIYAALARSADSAWLRLDVAGVPAAWAPLGFGTLQGDPLSLPVGASSPAATAPPPLAPSPVMPSVSSRAREIYQIGLARGSDPHAFSKVGDCQSVVPYFLAPFDKAEYRLGPAYAYLQDTITNFAGDFARDSIAAHDGLNVKSVFDPIWSDPKQCAKGENPLACEYRLNRPSIVIISLGTNGSWQTSEEYEGYLRQILNYSIAQGVLPILSTKADNLEGGDRFNVIVSKLAGEYQLPLWNFAAAARALPNSGLGDAYHLTWGQAFFDRPGPLLLGWQVRNLTGLQALDTVWRAVR